jgi:hypothetical protein
MKEAVKSLFVLLLVVFIISGCAELTGQTTNTTQKGTSDISNEFMDKCKTEFNNYVDISEAKFGISINLLKTEEVNDLPTAQEFVNTWQSILTPGGDIPGRTNVLNPPTPSFPVVLFAVRVDHSDGEKIPFVIVCGNDGKIMKYSKMALLGS